MCEEVREASDAIPTLEAALQRALEPVAVPQVLQMLSQQERCL